MTDSRRRILVTRGVGSFGSHLIDHLIDHLLEQRHEVINLRWPFNEIVEMPLPADDSKQRQPDITKAKTIFGWEPKVVLD